MNNKTVTLLPCPFCGGEPVVHPWYAIVNCKSCGATMRDRNAPHSNREEGIKLWNTRVRESK